MRSEPKELWPERRLGELISVEHGYAFKGEHFAKVEDTRSVVVSVGNFEYTGGFRFETTTTRGYAGEFPERFRLSAGDILLVMTCQTPGGEILGIPGRIPNDGLAYLHNQRLGRVVFRNGDLDPEFAYWLFTSKGFNRHLVQTASGSKILHTAPNRIESYMFPLPPLVEQRQIAGVLSALNRKIESNGRLGGLLEAIADGLVEQAVGTDSVSTVVGEIAFFHNRQRAPLSARQRAARPGRFPYYGATGVLDHIDGCSFSGPHVLVGEDGSVQTREGFPIVQYVWGDFWVSNHAHVLTFGEVSPEIGFLVLRKAHVAPFVTGAVQQKLSMTRLRQVPLRWPRDVNAIETPVGSLFAYRRKLVEEAAQLRLVRDALLPRLISGEIRVPDTRDTAEVIEPIAEELAAS